MGLCPYTPASLAGLGGGAGARDGVDLGTWLGRPGLAAWGKVQGDSSPEGAFSVDGTLTVAGLRLWAGDVGRFCYRLLAQLEFGVLGVAGD